MNILNEDLAFTFFDELDIEENEIKNKKQNNLNEYFNIVGYVKPIFDDNKVEYGLSVEEQEEILLDIFEKVFYSSSAGRGSSFVTVDEDFNIVYLNEKDILFVLQEQKYKNSTVTIRTLNEKNNKIEKIKHNLVNIDKALQYIKANSQIESINYNLNFFEKNTITKNGTTLEQVCNNINIRKPKNIQVEKREAAQECIIDYREHNPYHELFVKLIIASMFTIDRKMAYFYFIINSDWGKSFWMSIFQELNIATEVKFATLESSPGPISPEEIFGKPVVFEDEFTHFGKEGKEYTHSAKITAKNRMRSIVPLYAKAMFSAEVSNSIKDNVERQKINRFTLFDLKDRGVLKEREIVKKYGLDFYHLSLQNYTYVLVKRELEYYLKFGSYEEAGKPASKLLRLTHEKYRIDEKEELMASLKSYIKEKIEEIFNKRYTKKFEKYADFVCIREAETKEETFIYIRRPKEFYLLLIEESLDKNFKGTSAYKKHGFEEMLGEESKSQNHPEFSTKQKCIKISLDKIESMS